MEHISPHKEFQNVSKHVEHIMHLLEVVKSEYQACQDHNEEKAHGPPSHKSTLPQSCRTYTVCVEHGYTGDIKVMSQCEENTFPEHYKDYLRAVMVDSMYNHDIDAYTHAKMQLHEIQVRESHSHDSISMITAYYTWWGGAIPYACGTPVILPSILQESSSQEGHYCLSDDVHTSILQEEVMSAVNMNDESVTTSLITKDLPIYVSLQATYNSGRLTHASHVMCHYEDRTVIRAAHYQPMVTPRDSTPKVVTPTFMKEVELISTIKNETFTAPIKELESPFKVYVMTDTYPQLPLLYFMKDPTWVTMSMVAMLLEDMVSKEPPSCTHTGIWTPTYTM